MLNVQNMAVIGATGICTNTRQSSHMIAYVHRAEGSANTCNDLRPGWGQTLLLSCRKRITFVMSALLFSALNICTVMSCFMCWTAATFSLRNCLQDFKTRCPCLCLLRWPWGGQCELGKGSRGAALVPEKDVKLPQFFFLKHFSWVKFTGQSFLKTGQFNKKKIKPNLYRNLCDKKNKCKKREECGH